MKSVGGFFRKKSVKFGIPFLTLIVGGSFGLKEFTQIRYDVSRKSFVTPEQAEKRGVHMKAPGEVTLESEYEKIKQTNIDTWENKRGPRPWEPENPVTQEHLKKGEKLGDSYMRKIGMPLPDSE